MNLKVNKTHTIFQGSSIVSKKIKYWVYGEDGNKYQSNLDDLDISFEIKDSNRKLIHTGDIKDGILNIPSNITENLNGYYYCNIIIKKGNFVDRDYYLGIIVKERP